jgi:hypothetical protein
VGSQYSKRYSEEFKRDAIALARSSDKTITEVARDVSPRVCAAGSGVTGSMLERVGRVT